MSTTTENPSAQTEVCMLMPSEDSVLFMLGHHIRHVMTFDAYRKAQEELAVSVTDNLYHVSTPDLGVISLRLPPLEEVRSVGAVLGGDASLVFERRYRILSIEKLGGGRSEVRLAIAGTRHVVDRMLFREFCARLHAGRSRGGTSYLKMLHDYDAELCRQVTNKLGISAEAQATDTRQDAKRAEPEEADRGWLREHAFVVYAACLAGAVLLAWGIVTVVNRSRPRVGQIDQIDYASPLDVNRTLDDAIKSAKLLLKQPVMNEFRLAQARALRDLFMEMRDKARGNPKVRELALLVQELEAREDVRLDAE